MQQTLGNSLNIPYIFLWNGSPSEREPNGSLSYLYLSKCHVDDVKYNDVSSKFEGHT